MSGDGRDNISKREHRLLTKGEVGLVIENYDEIFSDFDPRPYSQKALSVDFLDETRRATRDIEGEKFQLTFLLQVGKRDFEKEVVIKRRLREHFKRHADLLGNESKSKTRRGIFLTVIGFLMMIIATYLLHSGKKGLIFDVLYVVFEPGGWFTLWTGLDLIFSFAKEKNHDLEFYKKMVKAEIGFSHY